MRDIWSRIFSPLYGSERELFNKVQSHLRLSLKALNILEGIVSAEEDKAKVAASEGMREIAAIEREGDELIRMLGDKLSKGAISPTLMPTIEVLLNKIDDVLDDIHVLARELRRAYLFCNTSIVREVVNGEFLEMIRLGKDALSRLIELLDGLDRLSIDDIRIMVLGIEKLEEEVDEIKDTALDKLYSKAGGMSYIEFINNMNLIFGADNVLDSIKDSAYLILMILGSVGS